MLYAVYIIGFLIVVFIAIYFNTIRRFLHLRLDNQGYLKSIACQEFPQSLLMDLEKGAAELIRLGFQFSHCSYMRSPWTIQKEWIYIKVYYHTEKKTTAIVQVADDTPDFDYHIQFSNHFKDNTSYTTVNGRLHMFFLPKKTTVNFNDYYVETIDLQWQKHLENLPQDKISYLPDIETLVKIENQFIQDYIKILLEEKRIIKAEKENYRLTLFSAWRYIRRIMQGQKRLQKIKLPVLDQTAKIQKEITLFKKLEEDYKVPPLGWLGKTILFLISVLAFALIFGISLSWTILLILIIVLLIHESGHILAMYLFRYKELQMLFVPFFGAVAIGQSQYATVYQRLIIYLMGPMPGIFLAFAAFYFYSQTANNIFLEIGTVALILNYFNLLPVMPLDGGQIVNLTLFEKFPWLHLVFILLSAVLLGYGAWYLGGPIMAVIAIFLLILAPSLVKSTRILKQFRQMHTNTPKDTLAQYQEIFTFLNQPQYTNMNFSNKVGFARYLLQQGYQQAPSLKTSIVSLVVYLLALSSPLILAFALFPDITKNYLNHFNPWQANEYQTSEDTQAYLNDMKQYQKFAKESALTDLLSQWNQEIIANAEYWQNESYQIPLLKANQSILFPKAEDAAILALEQQLEMTLPQEYKDFLLISNGLILLAENSDLLPIDKVKLANAEFINNLAELMQGSGYKNLSLYEDDEIRTIPLQELKNTLVITSEESFWPHLLKYENDQWVVWMIDKFNFEIYKYSSFRDFLNQAYVSDKLFMRNMHNYFNTL